MFPTNPIGSSVTTVELPGLPVGGLVDDRTDVLSCVQTEGEVVPFVGVRRCLQAEPGAVPDEGGDFRFPPDERATPDPFAETNAWFHVRGTLDWMEAASGLSVPPFTTYVALDLGAAFVGDVDDDGVDDLSFGRRSGVSFAYDGDVVVHELGHVHQRALRGPPRLRADALGLDLSDVAIDEGLADGWSVLRMGDPDIGEYGAILLDQLAIREVGTPRRCPDDLEGDPHLDGRLLAQLAWQWRESLGEEAATARWGRLSALVDDEVGWDDLPELLRAAGATDVDAVSDCGRLLPLAPDAPVTLHGLALGGGASGGTAQRVIDVPEDAGGVTVIPGPASVADGVSWSLAVSGDVPVGFAPETEPLRAVPARWHRRGASGGGVRWHWTGSPERRPSQVYLALITESDGAAGWARVPVVVAFDPADGESSRCAHGSRGGWLAVLVLLRLRRRRR